MCMQELFRRCPLSVLPSSRSLPAICSHSELPFAHSVVLYLLSTLPSSRSLPAFCIALCLFYVLPGFCIAIFPLCLSSALSVAHFLPPLSAFCIAQCQLYAWPFPTICLLSVLPTVLFLPTLCSLFAFALFLLPQCTSPLAS